MKYLCVLSIFAFQTVAQQSEHVQRLKIYLIILYLYDSISVSCRIECRFPCRFQGSMICLPNNRYLVADVTDKLLPSSGPLLLKSLSTNQHRKPRLERDITTKHLKRLTSSSTMVEKKNRLFTAQLRRKNSPQACVNIRAKHVTS